MRNYKFVIADVFAEERFGGNQLAVFTECDGLDSATMQALAREMNYSETTFLFPPDKGGDYRVRIFTPDHELPFAGHPLVGSGHVVVSERMKQWDEPLTRVTLEAGVGPIRVEVQTEGGRAGHTTMTQPLPVVKGRFTDAARVARSLSIDLSEIERTGLPIEALHNGITVIIVPVSTRGVVERIKADPGAVEEILKEMGAETMLVFTRETVRPASTAHCRVFAPAAGVIEDAATGSANGPLGFYLVRHRLVEAEPVTKIVSEQGFEMKRPSILHIDVDVDVKSKEVVAVRVGGGVVITGRGEIYVE
jgi:trans-2,3-dihydro-3-hydroxyanthranilate isomerase